MKYGISTLSIIPVRNSPSDKEEMINHLSINNFSIQNINTRGEWIAINCKKNEK